MSIKEKCQAEGITWVGSEGPTDAKIVICGEAPGAEEERQGKPFVGGAGFLLDSILHQVGLTREQVYITNVIKVRPPENEVSRLPELGLSVSEFIPLLKEEVESVNPNLVVALGATALQALQMRRAL